MLDLNKNFIQKMSTMFTYRDGNGGKLSNQALKTLYSLPTTVNVTSLAELFDQSVFVILTVINFGATAKRKLSHLCLLV